MSTAFYAFDKTVYGGTGRVNQAHKCIMEMSMSNSKIGFPLGVVFLQETFDEETRESVG